MICQIPFFKVDISWFEILSTTILPVILFLSGYWLGKYIESIKENEKKVRLKKYLKQLLIQLDKKLICQIKEINAAANRQDDFGSKELMAVRASGDSHRLLKLINREELYEIIVEDHKKNTESRTKFFDELLSSIDFINEALSVLELNTQNIPVYYMKYEKIWNDAHMELILLYNHYVSIPNQLNIEDRLLDELSKIMKKMNDLKKNEPYIENLQIAFNEIITPINELLKSITYDERTPKLMNIIQNSIYAFNGMLDCRKNNKNNYLTLGSKLEESRKTIVTLTNEI